MRVPPGARFGERSIQEARQDLGAGQPCSADLIVAHADVDGMVAAAALLRTLPDDSDLRFSSYRLLPEYLSRLAEAEVPPRRIWVADLGVGSRELDRALRAIETLIRRGSRFYWFDHHAWDAGAAREVGRRAEAFHVVPGIARPATLVVLDVLTPGEAFARLARRIVVERAASSDRTAAAWFRLLSCLGIERDWATIHRAVRRLSRMEALQPGDIARLEDHPCAAEMELVADRLRVGMTERGCRYATLDIRDARIRLAALRDVCRSHDVDFIVTVSHAWELFVDGLHPIVDLGLLCELDGLETVAHVCPNVNPVPIELVARHTEAEHDEALGSVISWIDSNM